jgi:DNA-binding MarR family transcriptional regulator
MNDINEKPKEDFLDYQSLRLQTLIGEILGCCEGRKIYESQTFGLPYAEIKCLMLFADEHYLTIKGMAQKMDVAKSRVTKLVDNLVKKKFLNRIDDPKDARIKLISLTPDGKKKQELIDIFHREIHKKILLQIDAEERKNIISTLERLRSAMEAVKETLV